MNHPTEKTCSNCGESKPLDLFHKSSSCQHGRQSNCKSCRNAKAKEYGIKNREKLNEKDKVYREENKEKLAKRDRIRAKKYYAENKESAKEYRKENKDRIRENKKNYYKTPEGKIISNRWNRKRRSLKLNQLHPDHDFEIEKEMELERLKLEKETGKSYQLDHIWPLSRGGLHHHENLQVISSLINKEKSNSLEFKHPKIKHWSDLPRWLIEETLNWKAIN